MSLPIIDGYATVWKPEAVKSIVKCNISSSRRDKENDTWVNSNWNNVIFVGKCVEKALKLVDGDRIKIISAQIKNEPYEKTDGTRVFYPNITIFDFDSIVSTKSDDKKKNVEEETDFRELDDDDDSVPF